MNVRDDNEPEESDSDKQSDAETYEYENITNKDDVKIKQKIDEAHKNIQNVSERCYRIRCNYIVDLFSLGIIYGKIPINIFPSYCYVFDCFNFCRFVCKLQFKQPIAFSGVLLKNKVLFVLNEI